MPIEDIAGAAPAAPVADTPEETEQHVLCTISLNADGTFQLQSGEDEGMTYESAGELLKALLPVLRGASEGPSAEEDFEAGYNDTAEPTMPTTPTEAV